MEPRSLNWVARALSLPANEGYESIQITDVTADTRHLEPGALFVALTGDQRDGHDFVYEAHLRGAVAAIVSRPVDAPLPQLVIPNPLVGLGQVAQAYLAELPVRRIALTGSVGKTSTKEMMTCLLKPRYLVHASAGNFNNELGVPLTALSCAPDDQVAIFEMGMRGPDEIRYLAEIVRPEIAVITRLGMTHIERLGSREAIAKAKGELLQSLSKGGVAILPADSEYLDLLRSLVPTGASVKTYGRHESADVRLADVKLNPKGCAEFTLNGVIFQLSAPGIHLAECTAAAAATVLHCGMKLEDLPSLAVQYSAPPMRMQRLELPGGGILLNDCYNAAPDSMAAALETLAAIAGPNQRRKVAVLGEMRELGEHSREAHERVGEAAKLAHLDLLVTVGEAADPIGQAAQAANWIACTGAADAAERAIELVQPGDVVLVKGSRSIGLERVVQALLQT